VVATTIQTADVLISLKSQSSLETASNAFDRADWMLWFLEIALKMSLLENEFDSRVRLFAVWCARACSKAFKVQPTAEASDPRSGGVRTGSGVIAGVV
jgi:hypothetical protein